jgi:hypothetical protein
MQYQLSRPRFILEARKIENVFVPDTPDNLSFLPQQ